MLGFNPLSIRGLVGCLVGALGSVFLAATCLYFALLGMAIQALPTGQDEAWAWVLGSQKNSPLEIGNAPRGWPVNGRITSYFQDPAYNARFGRIHWGIDISSSLGTQVLNTLQGRVVFAGPAGNYGNLVIVQNGPFAVYFAHLAAILVVSGQIAQSGQTVGVVGDTGRAEGVHLHYEIRHQGTPVDPLPYLGS